MVLSVSGRASWCFPDAQITTTNSSSTKWKVNLCLCKHQTHTSPSLPPPLLPRSSPLNPLFPALISSFLVPSPLSSSPLLSSPLLSSPLLSSPLLSSPLLSSPLLSSPLLSSPLLRHGPGTHPVCAHMLHLQHAILHPKWQRDPRFFIHSHYLHKQSPAPFLRQSQLNLYGSFMYCLLTVPFCPPVVGLGRGYNEAGRMEADWRNAPQ